MLTEAIKNVVDKLAKMASDPDMGPTPDEALKYSQAALNLAHAASVLANIK